MKVRIVEWCEYLSECPVDLGITDNITIAVLPVDGTEDVATHGAIEMYKQDRVREDYEGQTTWAFGRAEQRGKPMTEEEKATALEYAATERDSAEYDFEGYYDGFFHYDDCELGKYLPYVREEAAEQ